MRTSTDPCDPRFFSVLTQHRPDVPGNRDGSSRRHPRPFVVEAEFGHGVELALQEPGHRLAVDDRLAGLLGHIEAALGGGKVAFVIFGETHQCGAPILVIQQFLLPFLKFQIFKIFKAAFSLYLYKVFFSFVFIFFYFLFFYLSRFCVGFSNFRVSFVSCSSVFVAIFIIFES